MPYQIKQLPDGRYAVINRDTGQVYARHTSRRKAEMQVRLLHGVEHGWQPTRRSK